MMNMKNLVTAHIEAAAKCMSVYQLNQEPNVESRGSD